MMGTSISLEKLAVLKGDFDSSVRPFIIEKKFGTAAIEMEKYGERAGQSRAIPRGTPESVQFEKLKGRLYAALVGNPTFVRLHLANYDEFFTQRGVYGN
jgi:hypothetical protein